MGKAAALLAGVAIGAAAVVILELAVGLAEQARSHNQPRHSAGMTGRHWSDMATYRPPPRSVP